MNKMISVLMAGMTALTVFLSGNASAQSAETENTQAESVSYTIQDIRNLQDFLLARPTEENLNGKPYDLDGDGVWSVFDLCLMRQEAARSMPEDTNSDILVVYFSRTGNTEKIAEYLIELTDADSYVIEAAVPYTDEDIAYNNSSCCLYTNKKLDKPPKMWHN